MTTPAPALALNVAADKASYRPGEEMVITVEAVAPVSNKVTVSGSQGGITVNGEIEVTVNMPAEGVSFGVSDTLGSSFTQEPGSTGAVVFKAAAPAAPAA